MTKKYLDDTGLSNLVSNIKGIIPKVYYGTCSTSGSVKDKIVVCEGFVLEEGASIRVFFENGEDTNADIITLDVNNTGAKRVYGNQSGSTYGYLFNAWQTGEVVDFTYNGTGWIINKGGKASTSYYGLTKLNSSINSNLTTMASTPSAVKQAYDLANSKQDAIRYVTFILSSNQSIVKNTFTKINYDTTEREGTAFATISSGTITFSEEGSYLLIMNTIFDTNNTGGRYQDAFVGGGAYAVASSTGATGVRTALNSSALISFDANDTFYGRAYQTTSGNLNLIGGSRITIIKIK